MHLPQRGRGDRPRRETDECLVGHLAKGFLETARDYFVGPWRDFVLQAFKFFGVFLGQEGAHDRQHLAELDVHAAQADEALVHAARVAAIDLRPALFVVVA